MAIVTIRVPQNWAGKLDSAKVRDWIGEFLKDPAVLPADPGPGPLRISISVPRETEAIFRRIKKGTLSRELRRIIRARLDPTGRLSSSNGRYVATCPIEESAKENQPISGSHKYAAEPLPARAETVFYVMGVGWAPPVAPIQMGIGVIPPPRPIYQAVANSVSLQKESGSNEIVSVKASVISRRIRLIYIVAIVLVWVWVISGPKISQ